MEGERVQKKTAKEKNKNAYLIKPTPDRPPLAAVMLIIIMIIMIILIDNKIIDKANGDIEKLRVPDPN